ncbi:MAG: lamin tail domain-containing protein [Minicystis sp.]
MNRRSRIGAAVGALIAAAAGCGYPTFSYGPGNGGSGGQSSSSSSGAGGTSASSSAGTGGDPSSSTSASSSTSSASSSSSTSASSTGGPVCGITHLLISEVRLRGPGGIDDEFVELYNPTDAPIKLDSTWTIKAASIGSVHVVRWVGSGANIPAHGHYLIAGGSYAGSVAADDALAPPLTDASVVRLEHAGTAVDILCFYFDVPTLAGTSIYTCEGNPILNPHNDTDATNTDQSLERRPGGNLGHCVDTDANDLDFVTKMPSKPQDAASAPTPP